MASVKAKITPEVLEWARTSAGFTIEEAAKKVRVKPQKLHSWEIGKDQPTVNQLRLLAKAFKRPLSVLYLSERPKDFQLMHDFRRMPGEVAQVYTPALRMEIRGAYQRRELALDLLEDIAVKPLRFQWRASIRDNPEDVGQRIREALSINYSEQIGWREPRKAYNAWRLKIESVGVLVFQVVGITSSEMRGFSIAEEVLPVIAVNIKDRPNGRTFSLLHEFAHLMLPESGLCDFDEDSLRPSDEQRVEIFCNSVAGSALVPAELLLAESIVSQRGARPTTWEDEELDFLSRQYGVSREVILRRLLILGRTTESFYRRKRREFLSFYKKLEDKRKTRDVKRDLAREAVSNYGRAFTQLVLNNYFQDRIPLSDVAKYLGIRARQLSRVEDMVNAI